MMVGAMGARRGMSPVRVGSLLTSAVPALGERMLEDAIRRDWAQTVGFDAARRSRPVGLRQGVLEVAVDNSPWLQELTLRASAIADALARRHGAAVTGVRFALGAGAARDAAGAPSETPAEPAVPRRLSADEERLVEAEARRLADPALSAGLRRLLTKDLLARGARRARAASERT